MAKYLYDKEIGEGDPKKSEAFMIEKAVGFFLENHMMERMVQADSLIRDHLVEKGFRADFVTGNTCIEVKVLKSDERSLIERCMGNLEILQEHFERVILLIVCEEGTSGQTEAAPVYKKVKAILERSMKKGLEFWISEVKHESDGITLVSYQNISGKFYQYG